MFSDKGMHNYIFSKVADSLEKAVPDMALVLLTTTPHLFSP